MTPNMTTITSITRPEIRAVVALPSVFPNTMLALFTGATSISFRNPNCLSHITLTPASSDENSSVIPTIPGAMNSR
jgi:hypothetical protein